MSFMAFRTVNRLFFVLLLMYHKITIGIMTATNKHTQQTKYIAIDVDSNCHAREEDSNTDI